MCADCLSRALAPVARAARVRFAARIYVPKAARRTVNHHQRPRGGEQEVQSDTGRSTFGLHSGAVGAKRRLL